MYDLLTEFKERMKIFHTTEDDNLIRILESSKEYIDSRCGVSADTNQQAKELVLERSRYAYNDSVEYFEDNFLSQILSLSFDNYEEGDAVVE